MALFKRAPSSRSQSIGEPPPEIRVYRGSARAISPTESADAVEREQDG